MKFYNAEHYPDPTAGIAIDNVTRESRRINRKPRKHRNRRRRRHADHRKE
jgi:hypothetical protein